MYRARTSKLREQRHRADSGEKAVFAGKTADGTGHDQEELPHEAATTSDKTWNLSLRAEHKGRNQACVANTTMSTLGRSRSRPWALFPNTIESPSARGTTAPDRDV